jgi:hypothetical protein
VVGGIVAGGAVVRGTVVGGVVVVGAVVGGAVVTGAEVDVASGDVVAGGSLAFAASGPPPRRRTAPAPAVPTAIPTMVRATTTRRDPFARTRVRRPSRRGASRFGDQW